jgi:hypothetical protein
MQQPPSQGREVPRQRLVYEASISWASGGRGAVRQRGCWVEVICRGWRGRGEGKGLCGIDRMVGNGETLPPRSHAATDGVPNGLIRRQRGNGDEVVIRA